MNSFQRDNNPILPILLLFLFALVGMLLFMLLGGLIVYLATDSTSINAALSGSHTTTEGLMSIRILQVFQTIGIFIFPSILAAILSSDSARDFLGLYPTKRTFYFYSLILMVVAIPSINFVASLNAQIPLPQWMVEMEEKAAAITEALLVVKDFNVFLFNLLMVAILPAIGEELFFRGSLQPQISRLVRSSFWGILITSALFSAIHFQFQGFIPRLLLGMLFGYLFLWTKSIWIPILVHFVNNAVATVVYFLIGRGIVPTNSEKIGEIENLWYLGLASLLATAALAIFIWRKSKQSLQTYSNQSATE